MRVNNGLVIKNMHTKRGVVYAELYKFDELIISATIEYVSQALHDPNRSELFDEGPRTPQNAKTM